MFQSSPKSRHRFLGLALSVVGVAAGIPVTHAADKPPKGQEISRAIAKEMTAAQKALQAQQWQEALKQLDLAEPKAVTPFDKKSIYDFKGYANVRLNKLKDAETNYEAALATGLYTPEEAAKTTRMLFQLSAGNQQYAKAIDYGKQISDAGTAKPDDLGLISQIYYLQKDCKDSGIWADKAAAAARKAGEQPKENWYLFKLQCASDASDQPGMDAAAIDLIKLNNKTTYWNTLLRIERQDERVDANLLMIYRIMFDTNSMNAASDYMEMAQLLGDAALPGEAAAVLDKGASSDMFKDQKDKDRATRLTAALKTRADTDKKNQASFDAEAAKNPAGELDVKSGEVFFGMGDYQDAVTAINRGLAKGGVKHLDEAYVYLGRSEVALKNTAEAKKAFAGLNKVPEHQPARAEALESLRRETVMLKVGDTMPPGKFTRMTTDGPKPITTEELFSGKTVVLFSVPGAFTPTCDAKHLPGFVELASEIKSKGVDTIACTAVNDVFVMNAWGKASGVGDKILMLADGNGEYVKALGLDLDATGYGMGQRGKRFALIVKDSKVAHLNIDNPGEFKVSAADFVLKQLSS